MDPFLTDCLGGQCVSVNFGGSLFSARFEVLHPTIVIVGFDLSIYLRRFVYDKFAMLVDGLLGVICVSYPGNSS